MRTQALADENHSAGHRREYSRRAVVICVKRQQPERSSIAACHRSRYARSLHEKIRKRAHQPAGASHDCALIRAAKMSIKAAEKTGFHSCAQRHLDEIPPILRLR